MFLNSKNEIEKLRKQIALLENDNSNLNSINSQYQFQVSEMLSKLKEKDSNINTLESKIQSLEGQLNQYFEIIETMKSEMISYRAKYDLFTNKKRQISDEQILEIQKLRNDNLSYSQISKIVGWSPATICRVLKVK